MEFAAEPELSSLLSEADGVYKLRSRVRSDIRLVQTELGSLQVALSKMAEVPAYELDERTKARAADLRNLYFQIQHDVDNLRDRIRAHRSRMADLQGMKGFAAKISFKIASIWASREFATSIREMKRRLQDSADRHVRYKIDFHSCSSLLRPGYPISISAKETVQLVLQKQGTGS